MDLCSWVPYLHFRWYNLVHPCHPHYPVILYHITHFSLSPLRHFSLFFLGLGLMPTHSPHDCWSFYILVSRPTDPLWFQRLNKYIYIYIEREREREREGEREYYSSNSKTVHLHWYISFLLCSIYNFEFTFSFDAVKINCSDMPYSSITFLF